MIPRIKGPTSWTQEVSLERKQTTTAGPLLREDDTRLHTDI